MESDFLTNLSDDEKIAKLPSYIAILQNMMKELQEDVANGPIPEIISEYVVDDNSPNIDVYSTLQYGSIYCQFTMYKIHNRVSNLEHLKRCLKENNQRRSGCLSLDYYNEDGKKYIEIYVADDHDHCGGCVYNVRINLDNKKIVDAFIEYIDELLAFIVNEQKNNK